jgi:hypothetical protein
VHEVLFWFIIILLFFSLKEVCKITKKNACGKIFFALAAL